MSVLQKLFSHPPREAPPISSMSFTGEAGAPVKAPVEAPEDLLDYVDDDDPLWHDPGEPPHWAPECGTPAYSTRHHTGA